MPHIPLTDVEDIRLRIYRDLPRANLTALSGRFIVEGRWLVERLAASDYAVESIVVDAHQLGLVPADLAKATPVFVLPSAQIEQLIGFNFHRGILACGIRKPLLSPADILAQEGPLTLVGCIGIHDPTNLGGILRNCAAFGVAGILLGGNCADPFSRRVLRVSMGTAFKLRIAPWPDELRDVNQLRRAARCELIATVLADDAERLESSARAERILLLIGNEGHGLPKDLIEQCDRRVTLPMQMETDSLNAAAASAVFLYHFTRIDVSRSPTRAAFAN